MFYVYIIQSQKDKSFYKGFSTNPLIRLAQHNNKEAAYTSYKVPWALVHIEIYDNKPVALKREKVLKKYSRLQIEQLNNKHSRQRTKHSEIT